MSDGIFGPYTPLDHPNALVRCDRCGCIVERAVGQTVHDAWHADETNRIRSASGTSRIGDVDPDYVRGSERPLPHRWDA